MVTHVTFRVSGERAQLAAFDARLKLMFAEQQVSGDIEEQHADDRLHYDLKVEGGIPFPPFALASREFPGLEILVEWVNSAAGTRGAARIAGGTLAEQKVENVSAAAGSGHALSIMVNAGGYLALALAVLRTGRDEYRGYALTGRQDALFRLVRDPVAGRVELLATQGAAEWSRAWSMVPGCESEYRELDPPQAIESGEFLELEKLAQDFVAAWVWFGNGPVEETAVEIERYQRLGYTVGDANVRSSALHRVKDRAADVDGALRYSTLDADSAWIEEVIARCWADR